MRTVQCRTVLRAGGLALAGLTTLILPACTKQSPVEPSTEITASNDANTRAGELEWAREGLKRNPNLEVVATDTSAGVFTIRMKDTGEVRAVKASELAAVPIALLNASSQSSAPPPQPPSTDRAVAPAPAGSASTASTDRPAPGTPSSTMAATPAPTAGSNPNYTIERSDGQVKVSGPGVSIVSTGAATVTASEDAAGQRSMEPMICEGRRMLHFDNRNISVDGDAIIARGGCELYITNSRISATGTGVVIGDATVHIANSTIEGNAASFDARDGAKVYVRSSTMQGLPRRAEKAVVQDQGGNQWR